MHVWGREATVGNCTTGAIIADSIKETEPAKKKRFANDTTVRNLKLRDNRTNLIPRRSVCFTHLSVRSNATLPIGDVMLIVTIKKKSCQTGVSVEPVHITSHVLKC